MRVLHIVPAAFSYFDDIQAQVESWLPSLANLGVEVQVFSLKYGSQKKNGQQVEGKSFASQYDREEKISITSAFAEWSSFDVVHLHGPFLGAGAEIIKACHAYREVPLLLSYHRPVTLSNFFSLFIRCYNFFYLRKIFPLAQGLIFSRAQLFLRWQQYIRPEQWVVELVDKGAPAAVAEKLLFLYNSVIRS